MGFVSETARLLASLDLKDGLTPVVKTMSGSLDKLDTRIGKSHSTIAKAGAGIGTAVKVGAAVAVGALGGLAALSIELAHEGQAAQEVQVKYANAIKNSGKVSADYVTRLNAQQDALLELSGADDEAIKAAQTQLILMGLTGKQVEKLTPLALDLSKATGKDLTTATIAVGKAAQGSTTALQRMGIILPKNADAVAELNRRFGGTTKALSGQLDTRLAVLRERLSNVREEAGIKLLPAMTKIVDIVGKRLVPAFGKFVDAILPSVLTGLDKLGGFLEGGGAEAGISKFLDLAKQAAPIIKQAASDTLTIVQTAVGLFSSLPPEIQALAVAGLTVNKLTGGLVTNLAGGLISAVVSSFHGLMNVNAAVVNVNGGAGAIPGVKPPGFIPPLLGPAAVATLPFVLSGDTPQGQDQARLTADLRKMLAEGRGNELVAPGKTVVQALQDLGVDASRDADDQERLLRDIRSGGDRSYDAIEHLRNSSIAADRNIVAAIKAQQAAQAVVNVVTTVNSILNGRLIEANLQRYHTYVQGSGITRTSGFLP